MGQKCDLYPLCTQSEPRLLLEVKDIPLRLVLGEIKPAEVKSREIRLSGRYFFRCKKVSRRLLSEE